MLRAQLTGSCMLAISFVAANYSYADQVSKDWEATDITIIQETPEPDRLLAPYWYLTTSEARKAIFSLEHYLFKRRSSEQERYYLENISKFRFQAAGVFYKGQKQILIKGICKDLWKPYMLKRIFIIFDGGPCRFEAMYSLTAKSFTEFAPYGPGWPKGGPE